MSKQKPNIAIVDGYGFVFRAYHSLPPLTRNDGTNVGAVYGFTNMLIKLLATLNVTHIAVVFDSGSKTFRNEIFPAYKANRPPCPEELIPQFPIVRQAAEALNLKVLERVGFEADDIIATLAKKSARENFNVTIVSSDKDLMQLINDDIHMYDAMKNKIIGAKEVEEKFFVAPNQVLDVLSLIGDTSDNVPGVRGIGPKTAAELIKEFGSFDNLLNNVDNIKQDRRRDLLKENIENARLSKSLISLKDDMDLGLEIDDLKVQGIDGVKLVEFLQEQGFRSLLARVKKEFGIENVDVAANSVNSKTANKNEVRETINFSKIKKNQLDSRKIADELLSEIIRNGIATIDYVLTESDLEIVTISTAKSSSTIKEIYYFEFEKKSAAKNLENTQQNFDLFGFTQEEPSLRAAQSAAWQSSKIEKSLDHHAKQSFARDDENKNEFCNDDFLQFLQKIIKENSVNKILFNSKELIKFLQKNYTLSLESFDDVSMINHLLNSSIRNDLRELIDINLDEDIENQSFGKIFENLTKQKVGVEIFQNEEQKINFYCFKNYAISQIFNILKPQIFAKKLNETYISFEKPLINVLARMENVGIKIDVIKLKELSEEFAKEIEVLTKEIYALSGEEFNIASPKQLGEVLFGKLGLESSKKSKKTGVDSTRSSVLEELAAEGNIIADKILQFRHFSKLKNTYTDSLPKQINQQTGRVHTNFSNITTLTGRLSSINPNLQNIPIKSIHGRKIREAFVAKKDHLLISADYSQIELRVLAHMAGIEQLKIAFRQNKDIHKITASEIFGVKEEDVSDELRSKAKAINFGIIYGISGFGLARQLKISRSDASNYIKSYLQKYPGIDSYMKSTIEFAHKNEFVSTIGGRKCFIRDINGKNPILKNEAERQAINAPIQGSAADIMKKAMIKLDEKLQEYFQKTGIKADILLQIHDELIIETPKENAEEIAQIVKSTMEKAMILELPLKADLTLAASWK